MAGDGPVSAPNQDIVSLLLSPTPAILARVQSALYPAHVTPAEVLKAVGEAVLTEVTTPAQSPVGRKVRVVHNEFVGTITSATYYSAEGVTEVEIQGPSGTPTDAFVLGVEGTDIAARTDVPGEANLFFLD